MSVSATFDSDQKICAEYLPNPYPFPAQLNNLNGIVIPTLNTSTLSQSNTLTNSTGSFVNIPFTAIAKVSGLGSGFTAVSNTLKWTLDTTVMVTFEINLGLTTQGNDSPPAKTGNEFTTVAPLDGGLPAGGGNPTFINLYTHTGALFYLQTFDSTSTQQFGSSKLIGSGDIYNSAIYQATLTFTTYMKKNDFLTFSFGSNSYFNQNWNGGPNATTLKLNVSANPSCMIYVQKCDYPVAPAASFSALEAPIEESVPEPILIRTSMPYINPSARW